MSSQFFNMMKIPSYAYDFIHFQNYKYECEFSKEYLSKIYDSLYYYDGGKDFEYAKNNNLATVIKKKYREIKETENLMEIDKLIEIIKKKQKKLANYYRIECEIVDISPKNLKNALKNHCRICNKIFEFKQAAKNCCNRKLDVILQMTLLVSENFDEVLEIHLLTFDENPKYIFPFFNQNDLIKNEIPFNTLSSDFEKGINKIIDNDKQKCEFILEPLLSKGNTVFRVIDTFFI